MSYAEKVILFNRLYCGLWVLLSLLIGAILVTGFGILPELEQQLLADPTLASQDIVVDEDSIRRILGTLLGYAGFKVLLNLLLIWAPRKKVWWWAQLFNHVIGVLSCILTIPGILMLIHWSKPAVRTAYGFGGIPPVRLDG